MVERWFHIPEARGSSPLPPTLASVLSEELALKEPLESLLGTEGRRKLTLRHKTNTEDSDVDKVRSAFENEETHRGTIVRDTLLPDLGLSTG